MRNKLTRCRAAFIISELYGRLVIFDCIDLDEDAETVFRFAACILVSGYKKGGVSTEVIDKSIRILHKKFGEFLIDHRVNLSDDEISAFALAIEALKEAKETNEKETEAPYEKS